VVSVISRAVDGSESAMVVEVPYTRKRERLWRVASVTFPTRDRLRTRRGRDTDRTESEGVLV